MKSCLSFIQTGPDARNSQHMGPHGYHCIQVRANSPGLPVPPSSTLPQPFLLLQQEGGGPGSQEGFVCLGFLCLSSIEVRLGGFRGFLEMLLTSDLRQQ
jgi:hypothetical protein